MGIYRVKENIYYQLRVLNRLLDTRRIVDELGISEYKESVFINLESQLNEEVELEEVLRTVEGGLRVANRAGEFENEVNIVAKLFKLTPLRVRDIC